MEQTHSIDPTRERNAVRIERPARHAPLLHSCARLARSAWLRLAKPDQEPAWRDPRERERFLNDTLIERRR